MAHEIQILKGRLGAERHHRPDADHSALRAELRAAVLAEHVKRVLAEAPPLTEEQRNRIAGILRAGGTAHA